MEWSRSVTYDVILSRDIPKLASHFLLGCAWRWTPWTSLLQTKKAIRRYSCTAADFSSGTTPDSFMAGGLSPVAFAACAGFMASLCREGPPEHHRDVQHSRPLECSDR